MSNPKRILIVDDNLTNIDVLFEYLEKANYEVLVAVEGKAALEQINYLKPDIILLDVMMPDISGFEVCRRLKANPETADIPVLLMTALSEIGDKVEGFEAGAVDYITKPIHYQEVLMRLKTHLTLQDLQTELRQANQTLEERVMDRTHRLQVLASLSEHLNQIFDFDHLLEGLVHRVKESFRFYHVHIYLMDDEQQQLIMIKGAGKIGETLKKNSHRLPLDKGIVGLVARTNESYLSNDVRECPHFWPNPLLPHTQSELAIPLRGQHGLLGVLDVQSDQISFFREADMETLQAIADQAAVAISNAQLLHERQQTISELQKVDRMKSEFLTMMSHELRTPLNSILGFSDLLLQGISGELDEYVMGDIQLIHNSGQHLLALINNVLDLSKIEGGMMELVCEALDAGDIVREVGATSMVLATSKHITLEMDIAPNIPPIEADKTRIKQILFNLVENALKFTHTGQITLQLKPLPTQAQFAVIDTGIGISEEIQPRLFQRFQQADMSNTRAHGGMGLGLVICKNLVELHRGDIWFETVPGEGTTFFFTVPFA